MADLPLHDGRVPSWMLRLMERMAGAIARAIVETRGADALLKGLSDPLWFQAFNNVIGMDWDSSGSTTVLTGVLKSVTWRSRDLGVLVLGGKGGRMRSIADEARVAERLLGVSSEDVVRFSKLAARADSVFLQDGYTLYHHAVIVSNSGRMIVVQQGMSAEKRLARRYHVDKASLEEPHSGVAGALSPVVLNATATESREARRAYADILAEGARRVERMIAEANAILRGQLSLGEYIGERDGSSRRSGLLGAKPYYYPVEITPGLRRALEDLERFSVSSETELALAPSLGPRVLRALALVADLILGVPTSTRDVVTLTLDPYAYSYAVGGKDGVPYPYDRATAEKVVATLEEAIELAKLGDREKLRALLKLKRLIERVPHRPPH
ncbi:MAG: DUF763 domain-containing protein, partial [Acidilobaceae archaeon]